MRRLTFGLALLALTGCNNERQSADTNGIDQGVGAEAIGGNDVTAIDAATNDAANMAADAELEFNSLAMNETGGNEADTSSEAANRTGHGNSP